MKGEEPMKLTKKWGFILLAVWLILSGVLAALNMVSVVPGIVFDVIAVAAGVLILIDK